MRTAWTLLLASSAIVLVLATAGRAADTSFAKIERGKHLVDAGDCAACHTDEKGQAFAGGRAIETPFGTIFSPNITPDRETGIGAWSDDDFYRAMHNGVAADGSRLYPAFPYPYFTKLTHDDVMAIRAYLKTLPALKHATPRTQLDWPLNYRVTMCGWDLLFFKPGTFKPDPKKSAEWNRGAYLVQGAGHCGACHTAKNTLGADEKSKALRGGMFANWLAPEIANNMRTGTGSWSIDDIVEYLKTGRNKYSGASGPMSEVVADSTSKLPEADLRAIATYIKDADGGPTTTPPPLPNEDDKVMAAGRAIYDDSCSACHQADGKGVPRMFPPLVHNANAQQHDPTTLIRILLQGTQTVATDKRPTPFAMPAFDWKLKDDQIAAVATFVRNAWGNSAPPVTPKQVANLRQQLQQQPATE